MILKTTKEHDRQNEIKATFIHNLLHPNPDYNKIQQPFELNVAPFSEIKAIWLAFDSLFYFTTEHLILREKGGKSSKYPFWKDLGFGG